MNVRVSELPDRRSNCWPWTPCWPQGGLLLHPTSATLRSQQFHLFRQKGIGETERVKWFRLCGELHLSSGVTAVESMEESRVNKQSWHETLHILTGAKCSHERYLWTVMRRMKWWPSWRVWPSCCASLFCWEKKMSRLIESMMKLQVEFRMPWQVRENYSSSEQMSVFVFRSASLDLSNNTLLWLQLGRQTGQQY